MATKIGIINSNQAEYTDEEFSVLQTELLSEGVLNSQSGNIDLKVTQHGAGDMTVDVNSGAVMIDFLKGGITWKVTGKSNAVLNMLISPNGGGTDRVDAIVVHLQQDEPNSLKNNVMEIVKVDGSGATALSDGDITTALGDTNWSRLADITVVPSATQILTANISDTRQAVNIGRNDGSYKTIFRGDGQYLDGVLNNPVDEDIIPTSDLSWDIGSIGLGGKKFNNIYGQYGRFDFLFGDASGLTSVPSGSFLQSDYVAGENVNAGDALYLASGSNVQRTYGYASYGAGTGWNIYGVRYGKQAFVTSPETKELRSVSLYVTSTAYTGNFILDLYLADASDNPTGAILGTITTAYAGAVTPTLREFTFASAITVTPNTKYVLVARASGGGPENYITWGYIVDGASQTTNNIVNDSLSGTSTDSGGTWTNSATLDFQLLWNVNEQYGDAGKVYKTKLEYFDERWRNFIGFAKETKLLGENIKVAMTGIATSLSKNSYSVIDSNLTAGAVYTLGLSGANPRGVSQSFTGDGQEISAIGFNIRKNIGLELNASWVKARIYAHSGTYGTSSVPTGSPLAESLPVYVSEIRTVQEENIFRFETPFQTVLGTYYTITFEFATGFATEYLQISYNGSSVHSGNLATWNGTTWTAVSARDLWFKLYKINTGIALTPFSDIYLGDIPGSISETPGRFEFSVGKSINISDIVMLDDFSRDEFGLDTNEFHKNWITTLIGPVTAPGWSGTWGTYVAYGNYSTCAPSDHGGTRSGDRAVGGVSTGQMRLRFLFTLTSLDRGYIQCGPGGCRLNIDNATDATRQYAYVSNGTEEHSLFNAIQIGQMVLIDFISNGNKTRVFINGKMVGTLSAGNLSGFSANTGGSTTGPSASFMLGDILISNKVN